MTLQENLFEDRARALRVAERDALLGAILDAAGVRPEEAPITQPIPVLRPAERPTSWLSAG